MSKYLAIREVADMIGVSKATVRNLSKANLFPKPIRIGGSIRWDETDIQKYLDDKKSEATRCGTA